MKIHSYNSIIIQCKLLIYNVIKYNILKITNSLNIGPSRAQQFYTKGIKFIE